MHVRSLTSMVYVSFLAKLNELNKHFLGTFQSFNLENDIVPLITFFP